MNDIHKSFKTIVERYKSLFPNETSRLEYFDEYLKNCSSYSVLSDRKQMPVHLTASSVIISRTTGRILFVFKPAHQALLQPGGHILQEDVTPLHAAFRHLNWRLPQSFVDRLTYLPWDYDPLVPMDIDIHNVPSSPQDSEPTHTHFDFRYLFLGDEEMLSMDDEMSRKHTPIWKDINYIKTISSFQFLVSKLNISQSPELSRKRFYSEITQGMNSKSVSVIAVAHIIPDIVDYLMTMDRIFDLKGVIIKPKSVNIKVKNDLIEKEIPLVEIERDSKELEDYICKIIENSDLPIVLMDIGGWFAPLVSSLSKKYGKKLIGVVEDTENGLQKYEQIHELKMPVYSVARSPLKDFEDYLIGKSIVYSTDALLRRQGKLIEYLKPAIIGYGKIGKSIAFELSSKGLQPSVYDENPIRRLEAYNRVFNVPSWSELLSTSEILFSATGGKATNLIDFKLLKNGSYLISVTSSDDEFDFSFLKNEYIIERIDEYIEKFVGPTNYFYLVCNGNAVNFVHGACVGDFIQLVRSEMLCAVDLLLSKEHDCGIFVVTEDIRKKIANTWLRTFLRINDLLFEKDRDRSLSKFIGNLNNIILN